MRRWHYYDMHTGVFTGRTHATTAPEVRTTTPDGEVQLQPPREVVANTPPGCAALEVPAGVSADPRNRCVDLRTGLIKPYQPPRPAGDELSSWEWDADVERWRAVPTQAAVAQLRVRALRAAIAAHETSQARPQRELLLAIAEGKPAPAAAVTKLAEIEAAAVALRAQIDEATKP